MNPKIYFKRNKIKRVECAVPGCKNTNEDKFLRFYLLPYKNKQILKEWIIRIRNPTLYTIQHDGRPKPKYKICEIHFDYACKTEFNSGLHPLSLPTLHLPNLANADKPIYYNNILDEPVATNMDCDDDINVQTNMCLEICRVCFKGGLLYDIENSTYKAEIPLKFIINYLEPEFEIDKRGLKERICLDCVKQIIISYLTVKQIKSTSNIFSYLCPESSKLTPLKQDKSVLISYPDQIDMKSILADCNLICCNENNTKYLPNETVNKNDVLQKSDQVESLNKLKHNIENKLNTSTDDLPKLTATTNDLSKMTRVDPKTSKALLESSKANMSKVTSSSNMNPSTNTSTTSINLIPSENAENLPVLKTTKLPAIRQYTNKRKIKSQTQRNFNDEHTITKKEDIDVVEHSIDFNNVKIDLDAIKDEADSKRIIDITKSTLENVNDESMLQNKQFEENDKRRFFPDFDGWNSSDENGEMQKSSRFSCNKRLCYFVCDTEERYTEHLENHLPPTLRIRMCHYCNSKCYGVKQYRAHLKTHAACLILDCAHCDRKYNSKRSLQTHLIRVHGAKAACPICRKMYSKRDMQIHVKLAHENKKNRCNECNVQFQSWSLFKEHLLKCQPKVCLICSKMLPTVSRMRVHMTFHCRSERLECNLCHRKFASKSALGLHMRHSVRKKTCNLVKRVFKNKPKLCPICGKTVWGSYSSHIRQHSTVKYYKCEQCAYETNHSNAIQRHMLQHSGHRPFLCPECGHAFTQKVGLEAHAQQHEISTEPMKCKSCDETFNTRYERNVHAQRHGNILHRHKRIEAMKYTKWPLENKYRCLHCNEEFKSTFHLRVHIIEKHEKIKGYFTCEICNEGFDRYVSMRYHMHCAHVKNPDRMCSICDKVFLSRANLEVHMRAHSDQRPFKCDICPSAFKILHHLQSHIMRVHEDKRPFPCTLCDKAFRCRPSLKEHIRTHTGERHKCEHCDKTFAGRSNKSKHLREFHNIRKKKKYLVIRE